MSNSNQTQLLRESLRILVRKLGVLERGEASCCGITLSQCHTIVEIGRAGTMSANALTEILGVDKSTVSKSIDKLVNNEFLVRDSDPEDRRSVILGLSDKGQLSFAEIEKRANIYFAEVVADIPDNKREQVIESLQYLVQALKVKSSCSGSTGCCADQRDTTVCAKTLQKLVAGQDFNITLAEQGDFPQLHEILIKNGLPTAGVDFGKGNYYLARGQDLMGVIGAEQYKTAVMLRSLAVTPQFRQRGIAKQLIEYTLQQLQDTDVTDVYLITNTAEQYMANYGFIKIGRDKVPKHVLTASALGDACSLSSTCMHLKL